MPTTTRSLDFTLQATADFLAQLPPTYSHSLIQWPSARVQGDFVRTCANCHQIGDHRWLKPRTATEWETVVNRMIGYGIVPFYAETRDLLIPTLAATFSPEAPAPVFALPPPPAGDATRAVIYEWEIDPVDQPGCHDLELGTDGTVYTVSGMYALNPIPVSGTIIRSGWLPFGRTIATATCGSLHPAEELMRRRDPGDDALPPAAHRR
jgi:hypothetical protein